MEELPARPVRQLPKSQKPSKLVFFEGVWEFDASDQGPVRNLSTGYPQANVDNLMGVWEF
jgi:hypothetical protein